MAEHQATIYSWRKGRKRTERERREADATEGRTACYFCGEVVLEHGRFGKGRRLLEAHLRREHPDIAKRLPEIRKEHARKQQDVLFARERERREERRREAEEKRNRRENGLPT